MLERIAKVYCPGRDLIGLDLSSEMVRIATARLGESATVIEGDMSSLSQIPNTSCAAVINFFAIHHVDTTGLKACLDEWCRVLGLGGSLFIAGWGQSRQIAQLRSYCGSAANAQS